MGINNIFICFIFIFIVSHLFPPSSFAQNSCSISATKNGNWRNKNTWNPNRRPRENDNVCIPNGIQVNYNMVMNNNARINRLNIDGTLRFVPSLTTRLYVHTINVNPSGSLIAEPNANQLAEIFFAEKRQGNNPPSVRMELGLFNHGGTILLNGSSKDRIVTYNNNLNKNTNIIAMNSIPQGWQVGDQILVHATNYKRNTALQNDICVIASFNGNTINCSQNFNHNHKIALAGELHLANLTSNLKLRSFANNVDDRGHIMFMKHGNDCGDITFDNVELYRLGRTRKDIATNNNNTKNMYPIHFHICGMDREYTVSNSIVNDNSGWGFVNHRSFVHFENNVAFNFAGTGFVTEAGNERGSFTNNLAVGGRGANDGTSGVKRYPYRRVYLGNHNGRLRAADLAFHGDGFWISSPFIQFTDNVAAGNHGTAFFWYTIGLDDIHVDAKDSQPSEWYTTSVDPSFLTPAEEAQIGLNSPYRSWIAGPGGFMTNDLPVFYPVERNTAIANFTGLRFRYVRNLNLVALRTFFPVNRPANTQQMNAEIISHMTHNNGASNTAAYTNYFSISDSRLYNNEIGLHSTYSTRIDFDGMTIANNQSYTYNNATQRREQAATGIEMNHNSNTHHRLRNVSISGYPICRRASDGELVSDGDDVEIIDQLDVSYSNCEQNVFSDAQQDLRQYRK